MKTIVPIILIATSIAVFVFFTNNTYKGIKVTRAQSANYERALKNSRTILQKRDALAEQYKLFSKKDLGSIQKLLPDHVDNIQLILDINGIAKDKGMSLRSIEISEGDSASGKVLGPSKSPFSSILVSFKVTAPYQNFVEFLTDLERSLRIVDVTSLAFESNDKGIYDYDVTIRTYWLK